MKKLRIGDTVKVVKGIGRKKIKAGLPDTGVVKKILWKSDKVIVDGINIRKKCIKPTQENPDGGIVEMEVPIHMSNVSLISPKNSVPTRIRVEKNGKNIARISVKCGENITVAK